MNRRKLTLYLALITLIIWSVPYFIGVYTEYKYNRVLSTIARLSPIRFQALQYQREWRHARSSIKVTFLEPHPLLAHWQPHLYKKLTKLPPMTFVLQTKINHGPLFKRERWMIGTGLAETRLALTQDSSQRLTQNENQELMIFMSEFFAYHIDFRLNQKSKRL